MFLAPIRSNSKMIGMNEKKRGWARLWGCCHREEQAKVREMQTQPRLLDSKNLGFSDCRIWEVVATPLGYAARKIRGRWKTQRALPPIQFWLKSTNRDWIKDKKTTMIISIENLAKRKQKSEDGLLGSGHNWLPASRIMSPMRRPKRSFNRLFTKLFHTKVKERCYRKGHPMIVQHILELNHSFTITHFTVGCGNHTVVVWCRYDFIQGPTRPGSGHWEQNFRAQDGFYRWILCSNRVAHCANCCQLAFLKKRKESINRVY